MNTNEEFVKTIVDKVMKVDDTDTEFIKTTVDKITKGDKYYNTIYGDLTVDQKLIGLDKSIDALVDYMTSFEYKSKLKTSYSRCSCGKFIVINPRLSYICPLCGSVTLPNS
jgi:hypothetical protein